MRQSRASKIIYRIVIVLFLIIAIFPIYWMLNTSFKGQGEIYYRIPTLFPKHFTTEAYSHLLQKTNFLTSLRNSLIVSLSVCVFSIFVAYPTAYSIARIHFRGRRAFSKVVLFTYPRIRSLCKNSPRRTPGFDGGFP